MAAAIYVYDAMTMAHQGSGSTEALSLIFLIRNFYRWGLLGGNMENNIVRSVASYFQRSHKITTLRLDFRGVQVGLGYSEIQQVVNAAELIIKETNATKILILGYSYGSIVGASASSSISECIGYVMIAPPFAVSHWLFLFNSSYHINRAKENSSSSFNRLLLIGTRDNFTSKEYFMKTALEFPVENSTMKVIDNADHFFFGIEGEIIKEIDDWMRHFIV